MSADPEKIIRCIDQQAGLMSVSEAVESRRSVRAFTDQPVDLGLIRTLLEKAARAPSGGNLQPWNIHVVAQAKLEKLKTIMRARVLEAPAGEDPEYNVYPPKLESPYRDRRFAMGEMMYGSVGIPREDKAARARWFSRNFQFFGAPVGLFCYIERKHGAPQWSDAGMYLQTFMLLLREHGLDSCPQECWSIYPKTIASFLGVPQGQMLFTGMSIGWRDADEPVNALRTPRAPSEEFLHFHLE